MPSAADPPSIKEPSMKPSTAFLLTFAALVLPAFSVATAAELEWNQERVTALAQQLVGPLEKLKADLESRPPVPEKKQAHSVVANDLEHLNPRARELAQRLASGAGRAETVALFREIETLHGQVAKHSQEYRAPFDMHVHIDQAQRTLIQLARYYGPSSQEDGAS
jgi:hypothetical protein